MSLRGLDPASAVTLRAPQVQRGQLSPASVAQRVARGLGYALILVFFVTPFLWMLSSSIRSDNEIFATVMPLSWRTFVPLEPTLKNFADVLGLSADGASLGYRFGRNLLNSTIVSAAVVLGNLICNTLAAYFFSRARFPGKNILFVVVLAIMFVPPQATVVPLYLVVKTLNLQNSYAALILPWIVNPFLIFFLRTMFETIPRELDEAATIDGASRWRVLWSVIIPNSTPALVTMALLELQSVWNQFFWPLIAISDPNLQVIQVAIASQTTETQVFWGRTFAGSVLASLPIVLFLLLQRYYQRGVALSGLKEG